VIVMGLRDGNGRSEQMANWKRLTGKNDQQIDVNMDQVCYMVQDTGETAVYFAGGDMVRRVKETLDEIRLVGVRR